MRPPAWISQLSREGSVPRSQIAGESDSMLALLKSLGLVREEVQGNRRRVVALDMAGLTAWVAATYPAPAASPVPGLRAGNIARARRSKAGTSAHGVHPLLLRWFAPDPNAPQAKLTRDLGLVGLTTDRVAELQPAEPWTLLTVENWESFLGASYENSSETIIVAYTGGNIANVIVQALAAIHPPPRRVLHFGDYDWTGLAIFRRIRVAIPILELYVPDDIATLFAQFADADVLEGQLPLIAREEDTPQVRQIIHLIAQYNAGLEQEIVIPPLLTA